MLEDIAIFDGVGDIYFDPPDMPILRAPTTLYGIEPFGIGTGACESLRSYTDRLANAHRLSPSVFVQEVIAKYHDKSEGYWMLKNPSVFRANTNSFHTGLTAFNLSSVCGRMTGIQGLEFCTMYPVSSVIGVRGLIRKKQQYHCPLCLENEGPNSMYGQLIWEVDCISACSIHGVQLVESSCGAISDLLIPLAHRKLLLGICSSCGSVGYRCRESAIITASDAEAWKARQVAELISFLPRAFTIFSRESLKLGLNALVIKFFDGNSAAAAKRAGINKSVLWGWMNGHFLPSLPAMLNLCMVSGVSLVSVLGGKPLESNKLANCAIIRAATGRGRANCRECEAALRQALSVYPPVSVAAVARRLNLDRTTLAKKFPDLSRSVATRFKEHNIEARINRCQGQYNRAMEMINALQADGVSCSRRNLRKLSNNHLLPQSGLTKAIQNILESK